MRRLAIVAAFALSACAVAPQRQFVEYPTLNSTPEGQKARADCHLEGTKAAASAGNYDRHYAYANVYQACLVSKRFATYVP